MIHACFQSIITNVLSSVCLSVTASLLLIKFNQSVPLYENYGVFLKQENNKILLLVERS